MTKDCYGWCTAYLWIVPAKVEGKWALDGGELALEQVFQKISGIIGQNGKEIHVHGKLDGDNIAFDSGDVKYTGHVDGDTMSGTLVQNGTTKPWTAARINGSGQ